MTTTEAELTAGAGAPDLKLNTPEGAPIQLSMLWKEKPLALVFLGALEGSLASENAILWRDTDETIREAGGEVVLICGATPDDANEFRGRWNLPYPLLCDDGTAYSAFGVSGGQPGSFVLDKEGTVRFLHRNSSELDNPPTWALVDAVSEITGKTVEKPVPIPVGDEAGEISAPVPGDQAGLSYTCAKCGSNEYEINDMSAPSGMMSKMVKVQNRSFSAVTCRRCCYTELYRTTSGALRIAFDQMAGA
jgi:hypothetical protein